MAGRHGGPSSLSTMSGSSPSNRLAQALARERFCGFLSQFGHRHAAHGDGFLLGIEDVPVRHQHLALGELRAQRRRHDVEALVVVAGIARPQHLQALLDRQVRTHHQHAPWKTRVRRRCAAIAERPRDQHGHHHGLAGAGGHLAGVAGMGIAPSSAISTSVGCWATSATHSFGRGFSPRRNAK